MVQRYLTLALLAMIAGVGCNSGNPGGQVRQPPPLSKEALSKTRIIATINKNAEAIQSLQADPSMEIVADGKEYGVKGRMRMERDKDFRLIITAYSKTMADIGSNDKGFWFWVKDPDRHSKENNIYVCDYDHAGSSRLSVAMQPDWIMEAMGLRTISPREAATIDIRPGELPGQVLLTQIRREPNGTTTTKETLVNETNGAIIEHRLYAGASKDKKELIARATIANYKTKALAPANGEGEETKVSLPDHFVLDWISEKLKLEIAMGDPKVNPRFSKDEIAKTFAEPTIPGANRVDLAAVSQAPAATSSFIHETMPRPGIRLGQPQAVPAEEKAASTSTRTSRPAPAYGLPALPSETAVVGPTLPQGASTDPATIQATGRGAWRPVYEN